jgi:DNA-binding NtrC family response regulator
MPETNHFILIEDDQYLANAISETLEIYGHVTTCSNLKDAKDKISESKFNLAIIDIMLDGKDDGLEMIRLCKSKSITSIVLSSTEDDEITKQAYQNGCEHFLTKRNFQNHLGVYVEKILKLNNSSKLNDFFQTKYITQNKFLIDQITDIAKIELINKSLLISGETGVGKSLIGKLIHELNFDPNTPFIHINCSEIPENLLESELFGHIKGAFTGAISNKDGLLTKANNGVLFLDEIGTMPIIMQKKLLKAIDEKTFTPVGSAKETKSNFTLITATCEDLFEKIHAKDFRKDFYYRISGFHISIPPLKERLKDIDLLVSNFLSKSPRKIVMTEGVMEKLRGHIWPGNVRELSKTIDSLIAKSIGIIQVEDVIFSSIDIPKSESNSTVSEYQRARIREIGLKDFIKEIEKEIISHRLELNKGKITQTIQELNISSSTFYRVIKQ